MFEYICYDQSRSNCGKFIILYNILLLIASHINFKESNSIEFDNSNNKYCTIQYLRHYPLCSPGTKRRPKAEG